MSGLRPRPGPSAAEVALVAAAVVLSSAPAPVETAEPTPAWRFAGRWFRAGRYDLRRPVRRV
ncbi:MAG: hypothetical protein ACP5OV_00085 [Acidimicrobiales bacterium]